jgi:hypothetical protein
VKLARMEGLTILLRIKDFSPLQIHLFTFTTVARLYLFLCIHPRRV